MEVGHRVSELHQIIPPNAQSFQQTGECISQCLDQVCVASHIIKHILGSQITLRHFCWNMANVCVESWVGFEPWAWEGGQKGLDATLDFEIWWFSITFLEKKGYFFVNAYPLHGAHDAHGRILRGL